MWAYVKDGSIVQTNTSQTRLVIRGTEFPAKYANEWTVQQKKDYGVYEGVQDNTNLKDGAYYNNGASTFSDIPPSVASSFLSVLLRNSLSMALSLQSIQITFSCATLHSFIIYFHTCRNNL